MQRPVSFVAILVATALGGCAQGRGQATDDGGVVDALQTIDDSETVEDGRADAYVPDAYVPDAYVPDAYVPDAYVAPDACVPTTTQLLVNPVFDLSPPGTGWHETLIDPSFPIITGDDGVPEHSAPYKAWLGGFVAETTSVTDVLWQDIVVPPGTTQLVLTGFHEVRTSESADATFAFDTAVIALTQLDGTPIQVVRSLSNLTPTTAWTAIQHTFTQDLAGQTVRLRLTSTNDFLNATSFWFDTLALRATHCP